MTARVHWRRRAGPRPPKSKKGQQRVEPPRYGRIDGVRKWMVARHQGRGGDWLVGVARDRSAVCRATGSCAQSADRLDNCSGGAELRSVETPIQLNRHYEQSKAIRGECYANQSS